MSFRKLLLSGLFLALCGYADAQVIAPGAGPGGSGFLVISQGYPNNALTGTVSETNQAAIRIPANTMGPNGTIRITALWTYTNNANTKTLTIRFSTSSGAVAGGGVVSQAAVTTTATLQGMVIVRNTGVTSAQLAYPSMGAPYGGITGATNAQAVDTTADAWININGQLGVGTDTITLLGYTVEVLHQ